MAQLQVRLQRFSHVHPVFLCLILNTFASGSVHQNFDIRLAGSPLKSRGRVEIFYGGQWGTIADTGDWTNLETKTVCRQLGYRHTNAGAFPQGYYGKGQGPVHMVHLSCRKGAWSLKHCSHRNGSEVGHANDVAVYCDGSLRLYRSKYEDRTSSQKGVIGILVNQEWSLLCTSEWTQSNTEVACRSLGYTSGEAANYTHLHSHYQFFSRNYHCEGTESDLTSCPATKRDDVHCAQNTVLLFCRRDQKGETPQGDPTMLLISGTLIILIIITMAMIVYLIKLKKKSNEQHRWITLPGGRQQLQRTSRRMRSRDTRRARSANQRHPPTVNSVSNGQRGNDSELPPYSLLEEDTPPPYSPIPQPRIEVPIVGREERYPEGRAPRFTETDAMEYFRELDAERLRLQSEDAFRRLQQEQSQPQSMGCARDNVTVVGTEQDPTHLRNQENEEGIDVIGLSESLESGPGESCMQGEHCSSEAFSVDNDTNSVVGDRNLDVPKQTVDVDTINISGSLEV